MVVGVVLTIGMPNMTEFRANSRMTAAVNDLHSAFLLSRTEAAGARENVTLCASNDGTDCNSVSFDDGWIVFTDINGDATVNGADSILRVFAAVDDQINITAEDANSNAASKFTFAPNGMGSGAAGELSAATICGSFFLPAAAPRRACECGRWAGRPGRGDSNPA